MPADDFSLNTFAIAPDSHGVPTSNTIYRGASSEFMLPPVVSSEIWSKVEQGSLVTQLARRIPISAAGTLFPIINGEPNAQWVGETREKPLTKSGISSKMIKPYKMAVIEMFSKEFRRDLPSLYNAFVNQLPNAIARLFDETVLYGPAPGDFFDTLEDIPTVTINRGTGTDAASYKSLLGVLAALSDMDAEVSAFVLNTQGEVQLLSEVDGMGRPFFTLGQPAGGPLGSIGNLLGRPVVRSSRIKNTDRTIGFAGDWANSAVWGQIGGISVSMSDQATINDNGTQVNLWQRNMFAVMVETEMVFGIKTMDPDEVPFVRLVSPAATP